MSWARFSKASFIAPYTVSSSSKVMAARRTPLGIVHTFSGLGLDRSRVETELKEAVAFEKALKSDGAGTLSGNGRERGARSQRRNMGSTCLPLSSAMLSTSTAFRARRHVDKHIPMITSWI